MPKQGINEMWSVIYPDGKISVYCIGFSRREAIMLHLRGFAIKWNKARKMGYRAAKIRIQEIKQWGEK